MARTASVGERAGNRAFVAFVPRAGFVDGTGDRCFRRAEFHDFRTGDVDVNWARQHHSLWLQEEIAEGRAAPPPPEGRMQAAE